ncbi:MAG: class I SAM-dependent methyltransferase [Deltaproteobacteria bacterium]|nr:class I SAM-dependent methyltransferase [Deltaproteobacteria bacterium]
MSRVKALSANFKLLDIGCGPGLFTEFCMENGLEGAGIDFDGRLIKNAKERLEKRGMRALFSVGRAEELPYKEGVFDVCVANSLLEHVQDWQKTLREATRVLKAGGVLVFWTTNRLHPFQHEINHFPFYPWIPGTMKKRILKKITESHPSMVNYTEHPAIHWFTYEQLKAFLNGLGYKIYTRLDLIERSDLKGWKAAIKTGLFWVQNIHIFRYLYYFYSSDVSVYAMKLGRPS